MRPLSVSPDTRVRLSAKQRREQLLDVTKELVGERGFHGLSVDAVARRAGISRPIVYSHFGDLGGLLEAMLERESAGALQQLSEVLPEDFELDGQDPQAPLLAALRGYLEAVRSDPVRWRMVLMPPEGAPELLREQIRDGRDAVIAILTAYVERGDSPTQASPDPELTARLLSAAADEAARLLLTHPRKFSIERLTDHAAWLLGRLSESAGTRA
jgi:AcrR family transcriptional regulator